MFISRPSYQGRVRVLTLLFALSVSVIVCRA